MTKQSEKPILERLFELAQTGRFASIKEIRTQLKKEGYGTVAIEMHLQGGAIRKELNALCRKGRSPEKRNR